MVRAVTQRIDVDSMITAAKISLRFQCYTVSIQ